MQQQLENILEEARAAIAALTSTGTTEELRVRLLGKKSPLSEILRSMGKLDPEERKEIGRLANQTRGEIEKLLEQAAERLKAGAQTERFQKERIDVTEPGRQDGLGCRHPITRTIDEISEVFMSLGYSIAEGPEIETVYFNFDALNAAPSHPSRDMSDTFYISDQILLRTQTSPVQARTLLRQKPPIRIISPGRCFRCDTPDATHSPMFHQVEGLIVDREVTMGDLKGTLDLFAKELFGSGVQTKFRPHFFPFTEPSAEMDVSCFKCGGSGCRVCKGSGWIEILGCGMVHPNVLEVGGVDSEEYSGFAFGMGVERIAMLKYGVDDIRLFYENDLRFIDQFK